MLTFIVTESTDTNIFGAHTLGPTYYNKILSVLSVTSQLSVTLLQHYKYISWDSYFVSFPVSIVVDYERDD